MCGVLKLDSAQCPELPAAIIDSILAISEIDPQLGLTPIIPQPHPHPKRAEPRTPALPSAR
jgi:hypothetical protein